MPVYFIGQIENGKSSIKIGVARDIKRRHRTLQTGNPLPLEIMGWMKSVDDYGLESSLHKLFKSRRGLGEWFNIEPADILSVLRRAGQNGFVAKNADAFQIIGYDSDAVPEYLGIWNWADLEMEECCPFCGCFCGMYFQDASSMYYCINCDTLTDFSELSPHFEE
jgi:Meiotically up-regulated gene 113